MDRSHHAEPPLWPYEPAHAAMDYDDDPPKEPLTLTDRIEIVLAWFAAGCIVGGGLAAIFY